MGEVILFTALTLGAHRRAAEDLFSYSSLNPGMGTTIRKLAELAPRRLALMHGPSFNGDCAAALRDLAGDYDRRIFARMPKAVAA